MFRTPRLPSPASPAALDPKRVRELLQDILSPRHFYTGPGVQLATEQSAAQTASWEVFRGRLLDPTHTRLSQTFETRDLYRVDEGGRSTEPLLSLKLDWEGGQLHIVRALLCHVWEGYDAGGNVFLSRETTRWVRELTGTVRLEEFRDTDELRDELICRLFHSVVGASRLPLTSIEAPLPAFALGELAYFYRPGEGSRSEPMRSPAELLDGTRGAGLCRSEQAKLLETLLHATPFAEMPGLVEGLARHDLPPLPELLRTLFNEVSLSPYTDLVEKTLTLLDELERQERETPARIVDFLGGLITQLGRHLSAYDLITFHHRGANYPDALLLDAVLKSYLGRVERHPELFAEEANERQRWRRRALRQGWLLRRFYEGHPVPDAPTSPGESMRVLPPPHPRVSEEQILQPAKRTRRLFAGDPLTAHLGPRAEAILHQSLRDLGRPEELRELGLALFLDRPLGGGKATGEPDQTVLLSHLAFSPSLVRQRLQLLAQTPGLSAELSVYESSLQTLTEGSPGIPVALIGGQRRPGAVSAADARQVADDFRFLRTTAQTAAAFFRQYDFTPLFACFGLGDLARADSLLILPLAGSPKEGERLVIHDGSMRARIELLPDTSQGYVSRAGDEYVRGGLRVLRVREATEQPKESRSLLGEGVVVAPIFR